LDFCPPCFIPWWIFPHHTGCKLFGNKVSYTIFKLCKGGFLSATSVGFIPLESVPGKRNGQGMLLPGEAYRTFTRVELLELSIVPVPSNPEALISARNAGLISVKEFKQAKSRWKEQEGKGPQKFSQDEIRDEFDFMNMILAEATLNEENTAFALALIPKIKRLTGSDIPEDIKAPAAIRSAIAPVIKALAAHHEAHNKCHDTVMKALNDMCQEEHEEEQDGISEELARQLIQETIDQIMKWRKKNAINT